ncbi:MAG: YgzB family protein [Sandaracinaceae bacterium]|nr:YgzB family protein [Sandaracinaceae bacterium]
MLRTRPERCPFCAHDLGGRLLCPHCREPVPIAGSLEERGAWTTSYLVEIRGPARMMGDELVFDATVGEPLRARAL